MLRRSFFALVIALFAAGSATALAQGGNTELEPEIGGGAGRVASTAGGGTDEGSGGVYVKAGTGEGVDVEADDPGGGTP